MAAVRYNLQAEAGGYVASHCTSRTGNAVTLSLHEAVLSSGHESALPPTDDDIFVAHKHRLYEYAKAHAPELLATLAPSWAAFGSTPQALWG